MFWIALEAVSYEQLLPRAVFETVLFLHWSVNACDLKNVVLIRLFYRTERTAWVPEVTKRGLVVFLRGTGVFCFVRKVTCQVFRTSCFER